jgi:hypothetical protein
MKPRMVWTLFFFATLLLSLPSIAGEKRDHRDLDDCTCSPAKVAGAWGYSETGTITLPAPYGTLPYASVGRFILDRDGIVSGERTASLGGMKLEATITGTATVNPDCTGTVKLSFTDLSGNPAGTAEKNIVYVDNAREARMIITSTSSPLFGNLPAVLVTEAKKLSPDHCDDHGD